MDGMLRYWLTFVAALGCGLIAGVFFAFSVFVMKALARIPAAQGAAAMQSINVAVIHPVFLLVFLGTGAVCVVLANRSDSWTGALPAPRACLLALYCIWLGRSW